MPDAPTPAEQEVQQALDACGGDRDAALLLLGHLLANARQGVSAGFLRLGPPEPTKRITP